MTTPPRRLSRFKVRLIAANVFLTGLALVQSPGLLVADTKFDLAVAPARFLGRALHLWDPVGAFGQLQNQAYGYLWPMGPFFLLGSGLELPGWVVQRLWLALVLCVAMTGVVMLARELGVRSQLACFAAGFAYALSPRMLTTGGPISIEAWPSSLAPWVLLPLVIGSTRGSPRRAAALAALAVAMVGGVNAAATFAVLPLGVIWLLTRTPGPRRRSLMLWWPLLTVAGALWWLVPLLLMGAYSPPFLDYIESASTTTFPTTVFDALRGTSNWVPYVDPSWRAGNDLVRQFFLPLNSGVLLVLGFVGIASRRNPHRLFLAASVTAGLLMVTLGHTGVVQGWAATGLQELLDGPLAPLRNVHKFDPVVRLPLVLGLAWAVAELQEARRRARTSGGGLEQRVRRVNLDVLVATSVVAVLGAALPALAARVTPAGGFQAVPEYWQEATAWLDEQDGSTLLVPGSSFGQYVWGSPRDEPLQALSRDRWAVRNAVPLTPPGNIRMLDALEARFAQGHGSQGMAWYLRRAGVTHLLVRNDLRRGLDVPDPVLVHQALARSPGLVRVAVFGPEVGGEAHLGGDKGRVLVNGGWQDSYPAIEIFAVQRAQPAGVGAAAAPVVVGGPEDLLALADLGLLPSGPTRLAVDVSPDEDPGSPVILTDGLRAVERNFGRVHDGASATLGGGQVRRLASPTRDYLLDDPDRWSTWAELDGLAEVTASSSLSDAGSVGVVQPGRQPFAAVDEDPGTAWTSGLYSQPGWLRLAFDGDRPVVRLRLLSGPDSTEVVQVRTANTTSGRLRLDPGVVREVTVSDPATDWLLVEDASGRDPHRLSLAEVSLPGVHPERTLRLPELPPTWGAPAAIVLRAASDARTGCATVDRAVRCVIGNQVASEEPAGFSRRLTMPALRNYEVAVTAAPRPGSALTDLLLSDQPVGISATTVGVPDQRASALAAVDSDPGTTWIAAHADLRPALRLNWIGVRAVRGLDLSVPADTGARLPERVTVIWPRGRLTADVVKGRVRFPRIRTDRLTVRVEEAESATSLDFAAIPSALPVGIGELRVVGVPLFPVRLPDAPRDYPCGTGPSLSVDGISWETSLRASPADLYAGHDVSAVLCGPDGDVASPVTLWPGEHRIQAFASESFTPGSVVLSADDAQIVGAHTLEVSSPGAVQRELTPREGDTVVAVPENTNPGWGAIQGDTPLRPVTVDGWQQGWYVDGAEQVEASFAPDDAYRSGLAVGFVALLLLVGFVAFPPARWRRWEPAPLSARTAALPGLALSAVTAGGLLAGWVGAAVAVLALPLALLLSRLVPTAAAWLVAGLIGPAAVAYALRPWGGGSGWAGVLQWPHYLVVVVLSAVLAWSAGRPSRLRPWWRSRTASRRWPGSSTSR